MIQFRQKEFIAPLVAIGLAGTGISAAGAVKSHADNKAQQEELDKQNALIASQNKKLEKLKDKLPKQREFGAGMALLPVDLGIGAISGIDGKIAEHAVEGSMSKQEDLMREQKSLIKKIKRKNPEIGEQAEGITKTFAAIPQMGTLKGIAAAAKGAFGKEMKRNVIMGTAMGGSMYVAGKYIQKDMKKNGTHIDPSTGMLEQKSYASIPALGNLKQGATKALKTAGKISKKYHLGTISAGAAFGGVPLALGYQADKAQARDMQEMTQRSYGWVGSAVKSAKQWIKTKPIVKHSGQTITGTASNLASFGIGGTKNIQRFGGRLQAMGRVQNNQTLTKMGNWIKENPASANLVSVVPGAVAAKVTWDGSQKLTEKATRAVDPKAYEYQDAKNQQV